MNSLTGSFEARDDGDKLQTPGIDWKPSERFVRVHHRAGSHVIYRAYGYTGWNGRGWSRKWFPTEYTLARIEPLEDSSEVLVTPLETIVPGRNKGALQTLIDRCNELG